MNSDRVPVRFQGHRYPQLLPPVDEIMPGEPAPWDVTPTARRQHISLDHVELQFQNHGRHLSSSPIPTDPDELDAVADARRQAIDRRSSVLVALFEEEGNTHVVLTRRAFHLRHHRGEIAFPGGKEHVGESHIGAALRETEEEIGVKPDEITPFGWLTPIATFASGSAIWPIVGKLPSRPHFIIDPVEVDIAFTVALSDLLSDGNYAQERWRRQPVRPGADAEGFFSIHLYRLPDDLLWGATARIVTELLCVVTGVDWPDANRNWT